MRDNSNYIMLVPWILPLIIFVMIIMAMIMGRGILDEASLARLKKQRGKIMKNKFDRVRTLVDGIILFIYIFYIGMILMMLIIKFDVTHNQFYMGMLEHLDTFGQLSLGLTTLVVAIMAIIAGVKKEYYLIFNIGDIFNKGLFRKWIITGVILELLIYLLAFLLSPISNSSVTSDVVEQSTFYTLSIVTMQLLFSVHLVMMAVSICWILGILLGEKYTELRYLKKLYNEIGETDSYIKSRKVQANAQGMFENITYLLEEYERRAKNLPLCKVEEIYFCTLEGGEKVGKKWYKKASRYIVGVEIFSIVLVGKPVWDVLGNYKAFFVWLFLTILVLPLILFTLGRLKNAYKIITRMVYWIWGYYCKIGNKEYFASPLSIGGKPKLKKYIISMLNIICFIKIVVYNLSTSQDDLKILTECIYEYCVDYKDKNGMEKALYFVPLYILMYYKERARKRCENMKECNIETDLNFLAECFKGTMISKQDKERINIFLAGVIIDVEREFEKNKVNLQEYQILWKNIAERI